MADKTINELTAATTMGNDDLLVLQQGGVAKKLSGKQLGDYVYNAAAEKVAEVNQAVDDARSSINDIVESIQSMTELGTDTTLTTTGMAADAKAAGDKIKAVETAAMADLAQGSASGSIVTITDGADNIPIKKMTVNIEPFQNLHGYDHPWPAGGGANVWDEEWEIGGISSSTGGNIDQTDRIRSKNYIKVTPLESYYLVNNIVKNVIANWYDSSKAFISGGASLGSSSYAFTIPENAEYMRIVIGSTTTYSGGLAINYPSSVTTYAPYSNICPITGWTDAKVTRTGFNLWDEEWEFGDISASTGDNAFASGMIRTKNYIRLFPSAKHYIQCPNGVTSNIRTRFYDQNKNYIGSQSVSGGTVYPRTAFAPPNGAYYMRFAMPTEYGNTYNNDICVNLSDSAKNGIYEPFGGTYNITFPSEAGTVYGGKLEINEDGSGVLTVDGTVKVFNGTETITAYGTYSAGARFVTPALDNGQTGQPVLPSNRFENKAGKNYVGISTGASRASFYIANGLFGDGVELTAANLKTWLSTNNLEVFYKLATPQTYTLTADQITTLLGTNNIWADTGDISEFIYRKAPVDSSDIDAKITAIESIISGREIAMIATKNYTFGSLVIVNDILYRLDANVASGETFTPETNCHITTVEAEIAERVPNYRLVNGKDLSSDITLTAEDIPYDDSLSDHTSGSVGEVVNSLKESIDGINTDSYIELSSADLQQGSWQGNAQIEAATSRLCTKVLYNVIAGMKIVYNSTATMQIMIKVYGEDGTLLEGTSWTSGVDEEVTFICKYSGRLGISWRRASGSYMSIAYYDQNNASTKIYNTTGAKIKLLGEEVSNLNGLSGEVGSGNAYYTGERISLAITPTIRKCQIDLWKEYTTTEFPDLNTYSLTANQSMAIYGNYVFLGLSGGSVCIIDRITKAPISISTLPITTNNHLNSAQFTDIFYDTADEFPLLLLSKCALISTGANNNICQVYRITRTDSTFTFTLINTITTDFPTGGIDWVIDITNKKLGIVGNIPTKAGKTSIRMWNCPTAAEILSGTAIVMKDADVLNAFELDVFDSQAAFAIGGLIFVGKGLGNVPEYVEVIDVEKAMIVSSVNLIDRAEVEGVYIFDGKLYVSQRLASNASKPVSIYEITF